MGRVKDVAKVRVTVAWKEELVGDEADTNKFYLRLQPTFTQNISLWNTRNVAEYVRDRLQKELNEMKGKK